MPTSSSKSNIFASEDGSISYSNKSDFSVSSDSLLPRGLMIATKLTLYAVAILLPLLFGGVHPGSYFFFYTLVPLLGAGYLMRGRSGVLSTFGREANSPFSRLTLLYLSLVAIYPFIQYFIMRTIPAPHPVLGESYPGINWPRLCLSVSALFTFTALWAITRTFLTNSPSRARWLRRLLITSSTLVALVALSHWFYDNGRLFWIFAPTNEFVSNRARWPFVNANHLAHFLLPGVFLLLGEAMLSWKNCVETLTATRSQRRPDAMATITGRRFQRNAVEFGFFILALLIVGLAIAATLSRAGWLGASVGIAWFGVWNFLRRSPKSSIKQPIPAPAYASEEVPPADGTSRRRRRRRRSLQADERSPFALSFPSPRRLAVPLFVALAVTVFIFFLSGRGSELITERVEYGLASSKDDIRWQLYIDTLPMVRDHFWLGVGVGNWSVFYPRYMSPELGGINPVYLHSEPLQALAGLGMIGAIPLLLLVLTSFWFVTRTLLRMSKAAATEISSEFSRELERRRTMLIALSAGAVALIFASSLDFTFRIPSIALTEALWLALTAFYIDMFGGPSSRP